MEKDSDVKGPAAMQRRVPVWMIIVIVLCALPGVGFPFMGELLSSPDLTVKGLTWFYPIYTLVSALLAWQCYGRRTYLSWVILVLMVVSHACFYYLAFMMNGPASYR